MQSEMGRICYRDKSSVRKFTTEPYDIWLEWSNKRISLLVSRLIPVRRLRSMLISGLGFFLSARYYTSRLAGGAILFEWAKPTVSNGSMQLSMENVMLLTFKTNIACIRPYDKCVVPFEIKVN